MGEDKDILPELVNVLRSIRRVLISTSLVRIALIYLFWDLAVCGFFIFSITLHPSLKEPIATYASWVYWGGVGVGFTAFLIKYIDPKLTWLSKKLTGGERKCVSRFEGLCFFLAWAASFAVGCNLLPSVLMLFLKPSLIEGFVSLTADFGILFSLASGTLSNFLLVRYFRRVNDYPSLTSSLILYASCAGIFFVGKYHHLFMLSALTFAYTLAGLLYLIMSINILIEEK